jgi:hypothetical protein
VSARVPLASSLIPHVVHLLGDQVRLAVSSCQRCVHHTHFALRSLRKGLCSVCFSALHGLLCHELNPSTDIAAKGLYAVVHAMCRRLHGCILSLTFRLQAASGSCKE